MILLLLILRLSHIHCNTGGEETLCQTVRGNPCEFPFRYKGVTHSSCTWANSQAPWCAKEIEAGGEVKTNKWEDCRANCPVEEDKG